MPKLRIQRKLCNSFATLHWYSKIQLLPGPSLWVWGWRRAVCPSGRHQLLLPLHHTSSISQFHTIPESVDKKQNTIQYCWIINTYYTLDNLGSYLGLFVLPQFQELCKNGWYFLCVPCQPTADCFGDLVSRWSHRGTRWRGVAMTDRASSDCNVAHSAGNWIASYLVGA